MKRGNTLIKQASKTILFFLIFFINQANIRGNEWQPVQEHKSEIKQNNLFLFETTHFRITLDSQGGKITKFEHKDKKNPLKDGVDLVVHPFEFIPYFNPQSQLAIRNTLFQFSKNETGEYREVIATGSIQRKSDKTTSKLQIKKIFRFYKDYHYWEFFLVFKNLSKEKVNVPQVFFLPMMDIGPKMNEDEENNARTAQSFYAFYYTEKDFETLHASSSGPVDFIGCSGSEKEAKTIKTNIDFFGMSSRFMNFSIQPMQKNSGLFYFPKSSYAPQQLHLSQPGFELDEGKEKVYHYWVYTGPKVKEFVNLNTEDFKEIKGLSKIHDDLYKAFDFGVTGPIRDLIVVIMEFLYKLVPNYGVGIILFAILFKLIFFPLNQKQAESMKKMQALQPKLKEINEKYADNPQEKQKKTMLLYKENKVNPLGGCLPILIQIPIFIALYTAFSDSYELWRSPFIHGWINDLSEPDTIYRFPKDLMLIGGMGLNILPLVMAGTQFLQTKFTTVSTEANQQKIMMFMPFILLFIFWTMPSGVVLYWTITNILSVIQQLYTNAKTLD